MNKKGQALGIGVFITVFITVLVGLILFTTIAQEVGSSTTSITGSNETNITSVVNGTTRDITGQDLLTASANVVIWNVTGDVELISGATRDNFTFIEGVSTTTGVKTIQMVTAGDWNDTLAVLQLTYNFGPDGFVNSSGGRAMANLIPIFFALLIAIVALTPTIQSKILDVMGR